MPPPPLTLRFRNLSVFVRLNFRRDLNYECTTTVSLLNSAVENKGACIMTLVQHLTQNDSTNESFRTVL